MNGRDVHVTYAYDGELPSRFAAPIQILRTARALCDLGAEVRLLTGALKRPVEECLAYYDVEPHERLTLVPMQWSAPARQRRRALARALRTPESDLHFVVSRGDVGASISRDLRRLGLPPSVRHAHEVHRPCFSGRAGWRTRHPTALRRARRCRHERTAVRSADAVVCVTEELRDELRARYGFTSPALVLPGGTSVPAEPPLGDQHRDLDVVYAGKLDALHRKGVEVLLEAMRLLPDRRALIAGGVAERVAELSGLATRLDVADRVTLVGFVPPRDVPNLVRRARVAVCPMPGEDAVAARFASPLKVLEAMANGAPVVASDLPTTRSILRHGQNGLLVTPDSPEALATGIGALLEQRARANTLAAEAFEDVRSYAWERRAGRLLRFLEGLD